MLDENGVEFDCTMAHVPVILLFSCIENYKWKETMFVVCSLVVL